jgi:hypothetical protein
VERELTDLAFEASDHPLRPDQYVYVETHAWWLGTFGPHNHLTEHRLRQWVPARTDREWLLDRELTGAQTWLTGSAELAAEDGFDLRDIAPVGRFRALHGDFAFSGADEDDGVADAAAAFCVPPRRRRGNWQSPTLEFFATLPRDADALHVRLQEENPGSWFGPFTAAVTALRTCLVPADLRTVLYRALAGLPAVTAAEGISNVDGQECLALVHDAGRTRTELMISPVDGQFAGERDTLRTESRCDLKAGTVISSTAVSTAVVDTVGAVPRS